MCLLAEHEEKVDINGCQFSCSSFIFLKLIEFFWKIYLLQFSKTFGLTRKAKILAFFILSLLFRNLLILSLKKRKHGGLNQVSYAGSFWLL